MSDYKGPERRIIVQRFGDACIKKEGGWNYDIIHGGAERRQDHPNYEGFWQSATAKQIKLAETL